LIDDNINSQFTQRTLCVSDLLMRSTWFMQSDDFCDLHHLECSV